MQRNGSRQIFDCCFSQKAILQNLNCARDKFKIYLTIDLVYVFYTEGFTMCSSI